MVQASFVPWRLPGLLTTQAVCHIEVVFEFTGENFDKHKLRLLEVFPFCCYLRCSGIPRGRCPVLMPLFGKSVYYC